MRIAKKLEITRNVMYFTRFHDEIFTRVAKRNERKDFKDEMEKGRRKADGKGLY